MKDLVSAIEKTALQYRAFEMTADEHESALARLTIRPALSWLCLQQHMHAVKIELPRVSLQIHHPFHPHDVVALLLNQLIDPAIKTICIKRMAGLNRTRRN